MVGWNERKLKILELIDEFGKVTSYDVAEALSLEVHSAKTLLCST